MSNPFCHVELATDDVAKAKKFYKSVFSWKLNDSKGGMPYTMINVGAKGAIGGGMMKKQMPQQPTSWLPYVQVEDVKKTIAKAAKSGAQVVLDYMSIGEMGAIGVFVDPTGAPLGVWEQAKKAPKKAAKPAKKAGKKK
jgi:predicted enzyme related to lactoylglutathione lyase